MELVKEVIVDLHLEVEKLFLNLYQTIIVMNKAS